MKLIPCNLYRKQNLKMRFYLKFKEKTKNIHRTSIAEMFKKNQKTKNVNSTCFAKIYKESKVSNL